MSTITAGGSGGENRQPKRVFRMPLLPRLTSLIGVVVLCAGTLVLAVGAILIFKAQWAISLFVIAVAAFMGALTAYCWRDLQGKWKLRVVLDDQAVTLDLPPNRSLIHRPPEQHLTIAYSDIAAIDARYEAYGTLGMEVMQRAYALHRRSGEIIFLFEERALNTGMASSYFTGIVTDLAARVGVKIHELGMVEGEGGLLAVWGTRAPDWAAPPLPSERAMRLWRHAAFTGSAAIAIVIVAVVIRLLVGG